MIFFTRTISLNIVFFTRTFKLILSYTLYYLGDLCYKLHLYTPYQKLMEWSVKLDTEYKVWKKPEKDYWI